MKIVEEDIEVLDMIIEKVLEKESINVSHLPIIKNKLVAEIDKQSFRETSYDYYFKIIEEYEVAEVNFDDKSPTRVLVKDKITERFNQNGGFRKVFVKQSEIERLEKLKREKEVNESHLTRWHKKTYWLTFILAILGFVIAVISLILNISE